MSVHSNDLRTRLAKVKGLGSAHHGVSHWWRQRLTALALIPLSLWFMKSLLLALRTPDYQQVADWFASPVHALLMVLLIISGFTHARLGIEVVVEDYVKHPGAKYTLLLANTFVCFLFAALCVLAVLKLHFLNGSGTV